MCCFGALLHILSNTPKQKTTTARPKGKAGLRHLMGVNLRDLFPMHAVEDRWFAGKTIAIDGHNFAWRYLTSIRGRDGDVLRKDGRCISHLLGLTGVVRQFRERGAEPVVVWDGPVHPRKQATVDARRALREMAQEKAAAALEAGDDKEYHRLMRGTIWLSQDMIDDATRLLETLGVAVTTADHDGERYAAAMCQAGLADAVATEDYDALVAGAPEVLRKAGGQSPGLHHLEDLSAHGVSRNALREVAIVCGTDWHPGVKGFGAKTAVKAIQQHGSLRVLFEEVEAGREPTRPHRLVAASSMDLSLFDELDAFIASLPTPEPLAKARPCPELATETAAEMGLSRERVLACFC